MLLVLLQNAWSGYYTRVGLPDDDSAHWGERHTLAVRDKVWCRTDWLDATWSCHTGGKLKRVLDGIDDERYWLDNTTLEIADKPSGIMPPDLEHVRRVLREREITAVLACGKQAGAAIDKCWNGPLLKIPHPACRVLTWAVLDRYNVSLRMLLHAQARGEAAHRVALCSRGIVTELPGNHVNV